MTNQGESSYKYREMNEKCKKKHPDAQHFILEIKNTNGALPSNQQIQKKLKEHVYDV